MIMVTLITTTITFFIAANKVMVHLSLIPENNNLTLW